MAQAGPYAVTARLGSDHAGGRFHLEFSPVGGAGVTSTAEFTVPYASGWQTYQDVSVPAVTLPAGQVRMRVVIDDGYPCNLDFFRLTPGALLPTATGLTLSPSTVAGGGSAGGTVTLSGPAPGTMALALSSDNAAAQVPASVLVYAGSATGYFTVTTGAVSAATTAHITASGAGGAVTATLTLSPTVSLTYLYAYSYTDGNGSPVGCGYFGLNGPAPAGGLTVALASDCTSATVPANVTVPAGSSWGNFPITVSAPVTAHITASAGGVTREADLPLKPFGLAGLSVTPDTVHGGDPATGSVWLTGPAPAGGVAVGLSSDSGSVTVPSSVTIPEGWYGNSFSVTTSAVSSPLTAHITANGTNGPLTATLGLTTGAAPSGLTATAYPTGPASVVVNLNWTAAAGASGYVIERSPDASTWAQIGTSSGTSYQDTTAAGGTHYWYRVKAAGGTAYSNTAYADTGFPWLVATDLWWTPDPVHVGDHVRFFTVVQNIGTATSPPFGWSVEFEGDAYGGYNIEANPLAPGDTILVTQQFDQWWTATPGTHHPTVVIDDSYETLTRTLTVVPDAPTALMATAVSSSEIDLAWTAPAGATGYNLYRGTSSGGEVLYKTGLTTTSYADTGLTYGRRCYYRVTALAAGVESVPSAEASAGTSGSVPVDTMAYFTTIRNTNWTYAGYGGMRGLGTGTLTVSGVTGTVTHAFLYWHGPTDSTDPVANATVSFAGHTVTGTNIGVAADNNWGFQNSQAYRADVTGLVTGNGSYSLADFKNAAADINGVSLMVFSDGDPAHYRDVTIFDGNDSNEPIDNSSVVSHALDLGSLPYPGSYSGVRTLAVTTDPTGFPGSTGVWWDETFGDINYLGGDATLYLGVGDGQYEPGEANGIYKDGEVDINGTLLIPDGDDFNGDSLPNGPSAARTTGGLWDTKGYAFSPFLHPGANTLHLTAGIYSDCLSLVYAVLDQPSAGAAQGPPRPMNLAAHADDSQVTLSWSPVSGVTYTLSRATSAVGPFQAVATGLTTTTYVDHSVTNGTTYYYIVTASDSFGNSAPSNIASATPMLSDFSIAMTPVSFDVPVGLSRQGTVQLTPNGGFTGTVNLTATSAAGILGPPTDPTKIAVSFSPTSVNMSGTGSSASTVTLTAGTQVPLGTYTIQLTGTDTSGTRIHSAQVVITVASRLDFSVSLDKPDISTGETGTGTVTLANASATDVNMVLTTTNPSISVDPSVVIPAGSLSNTFHYRTGNVTATVSEVDFPVASNGVIAATSSGNIGEAGVQVNQVELAAVATGHQKITLYWPGFGSATVYDVYRTINPDNPFALIASHVSTLDTGPGVTNTYMYSDTNGLVDGVRYYYYVVVVAADGTETYRSSIASDEPDPGAIPYDTGDPVQIVAAMTAQLNSILPEDDPEDDFNYGVGLLAIGGPDGVIYEGGMPGEDPAAYAPPVHYDAQAGGIVWDDGTVTPMMQDVGTSGTNFDDPTPQPHILTQGSDTLLEDVLTKANSQPIHGLGHYSVFNNPGSPGYGLSQQLTYPYYCQGGLERKVQTFPGFIQLLTTRVILPRKQQGLVNLDSTTSKGVSHPDAADIYTGGSIVYDHRPGVKPVEGAELDAGLEMLSTNLAKEPGWTPFINGGSQHITVFGKPVGNTVGTEKREVYLQGDAPDGIAMNFSTGAIRRKVIQNQVAVHFLGNYQIVWKNTTSGVVDRTYPQGGGTFFGPITLTSVAQGWNYPHAKDVSLKRMNTIAQNLVLLQAAKHGGHETVAYIWEGAWGNYDDTLGRIMYRDGNIYAWEGDETWREGGHPLGPGSWSGNSGGYAWWDTDNPFYSERSISLSTSYDPVLGSR